MPYRGTKPAEYNAAMPEECMAKLHAEGRSIGDTAYASPTGLTWLVYSHRDERQIRTEGHTSAEAWMKAWEAAKIW